MCCGLSALNHFALKNICVALQVNFATDHPVYKLMNEVSEGVSKLARK